MTRTRLLVVLLSAALGCLLVAPFARLAEEPPERAGPSSADDRTAALRVLRAWDRARAEAWQHRDPAALGALYTPGSGTGRADRALLAAYAGRGLRVTGIRMQLADVDVASATGTRIELEVTDRLVGAIAVHRRARIGLPRDAWSRRRIVLVRVADEWRVDQVSIVASTDSTSGSRNS